MFTQTGWPSNKDIWCVFPQFVPCRVCFWRCGLCSSGGALSSHRPGNSASVVASVSSEQGYYDLLDGKCSELKNKGVGWFAHIWSDSQLGG